MAEYKAPGVYFEEFGNSDRAIEGISTSKTGFIGMAQRGPTIGKPVSITSMTQFRNIFGGYLSKEYQSRYLAYGVEQFFANGGSNCYVMRVTSNEDKAAICFIGKETDKKVKTGLILHASSVGDWANQCKISLKCEEFIQIEISDIIQKEDSADITGSVKNIVGFFVGDLVSITTTANITKTDINDSKKAIEEVKKYVHTNIITSISENQMKWKKDILPSELMTAEIQKEVEDGKITITYSHNMVRLGCRLKVECDGYDEVYNVTFNSEANDYIETVMLKSLLVKPEFNTEIEARDDVQSWFDQFVPTTEQVYFLTGGTSSLDDNGIYQGIDQGPGKRTGIMSFLEIDDVNIMVIPGVSDVNVQLALIAHCEAMKNRFAILDMPKEITTVSQLREFRENYETSYAAIYHPWLGMYDSLTKSNEYFPPSASVAGIYARVDSTRGVYKAPANEVVKNCVSLSIAYSEEEQGRLNPIGVNLIRTFKGLGIRIWGARTMSSDNNWKYINIRRLFIYLEESINKSISWVVFEPNDNTLWTRVESSIRVFLSSMWRNGALAGTSTDEAFFINIGNSTMTQDDILNGRLICEIGVAPVRPGEFIIFRITLKMEDAL